MSRIALLAVATAIAMVAGCRVTMPGRVPEGATLAQTIDEQVAKDESILWAQRRPLTWADFKAHPPADVGVVAAETAYSLIHGARCVGSKFEYRVVVVFRPNDSWVRRELLRTPAVTANALRHEQTHFDLTEVHARRLRRYYAELMAPCRISESDLSGSANRIGRDEKAAQAQYDSETANGRTMVQQTRWEKDVSAQLVALAKYAR